MFTGCLLWYVCAWGLLHLNDLVWGEMTFRGYLIIPCESFVISNGIGKLHGR